MRNGHRDKVYCTLVSLCNGFDLGSYSIMPLTLGLTFLVDHLGLGYGKYSVKNPQGESE